MSVSLPRVLALLVVVFLGLVVVSTPALGQANVTFVDTSITEDATWTSSDGPYRIVSSVTVAPNATLTIQPGTTVEVAEDVSIDVAGRLVANGSRERAVRIVASETDPVPGSWGSIRIVGSDRATVAFSHTELRDGTHGVTVSNPDSSLTIDQSSLASFSGHGIDFEEATGKTSLTVRESRFLDLGGSGVTASETEILPVESVSGWELSGNTFDGLADAGIRVHAKRITDTSIRNSHFEGINEQAIRFDADRIRATSLRSNTVRNTSEGVAIETAEASALTVSRNDLDVSGTAIDLSLERNVYRLSLADNDVQGGGSGITIDHDPRRGGFYSFELLVTGNELANQARNGITLRTSLFSQSRIGIRNNTVTDTGQFGMALNVGAFQNAAVMDNYVSDTGRSGILLNGRHVRNTELGRNTVRNAGESGIEITAKEAMEGLSVAENELLDNAREGLSIRNGENTPAAYTVSDNVIAANAYGIALSGPQTGRISQNAVVFNTVEFGERRERPDSLPGVGVLVTDGATNLTLESNDIYGHRVGLQTRIDGTVSAKGNYWGHESGPYHRSINPEGEGNAVETPSGTVEIVEVRPDRVNRQYSRPTAVLDVDPSLPNPNQSIVISGDRSWDLDGEIRRYQFTVVDRTTIDSASQRTVSFESPGSYPVYLRVEDDMGIENVQVASTLVKVEPTPTTATPTPTTTSKPPVTTSQPTTTTVITSLNPTTQTPIDTRDDGPGFLGWAGGFLGALFYGTAVVFGTRGLYQTVTEQPLTVRGRRIQIYAGLGIFIWALASVPGPGILLTIAGIGLVVWVGVTGGAYLLVRYI